MRIGLIASGLNVQPLVKAIDEHPELWDVHRMRTEHPQSPHHDLSDIWIRYNAWENWKGDRLKFNSDHESVWYPASSVLPVKPLIFEVMHLMQGERLGGIFITKIPSGKDCKPHIDQGWHSRYYEKFAVQLKSNSEQAFQFEGEKLVTAPGDLFWFDNAYKHWVTNPTNEDRMTLIITLRRSH